MKSSSPFQDINKDKAPDIAQSFSFQTMQGDLLGAPKGILPVNSQPTTPAAPAPIAASPIVIEKNNNLADKKTLPANKNPFLVQVPPAPFPKKEVPETVHAVFPQKTAPVEISEIETALPVSSGSLYRSIIYIIIVLIVLIAALSGYYFWMTRSQQTITPAPQAVVETPVTETAPTPPVEQPIVITPPIEKYSAEKSNYLIINPTVMSSDEVKSAILALATEIKTYSSQSPYEFIVVDANNNPIAFPIFAMTTKLNLSQTLLSALGEKFSLFIYNDASNIRIGLSIAAPKTALASAELLKQEKTFVMDASFLFLDMLPEIKTGLFNVSVYNKANIRYFNVNQQKNMSIDYAITGSQLIISTSKNTGRAIIDKLAAKELSATANTNPVIDSDVSNSQNKATPVTN